MFGQDFACWRYSDHFPSSHTKAMDITLLSVATVGGLPAVVVSTDARRFIIDVGEGTQRLCIEHKVRLVKVDAVLLTRLSPQTNSGLPGLCLTAIDSGRTHLDLVGPTGTCVCVCVSLSLSTLFLTLTLIPSHTNTHTHTHRHARLLSQHPLLDAPASVQHTHRGRRPYYSCHYYHCYHCYRCCRCCRHCPARSGGPFAAVGRHARALELLRQHKQW